MKGALHILLAGLLLTLTACGGGGGDAGGGSSGRPPVPSLIGAKTVGEGSPLGFTVRATDPDGDPVTFSATGLPAGATLDGASGAFSWTPGYDQAGAYTVTFIASDGTLEATLPVDITVTDVNGPPVLDPIGPKSVNEGTPLAFTVTASDPDGDPLTYAATGLPAGAAFDPASGAFSWTPGYDRAGTYTVTFAAHDGLHEGSAQVSITVANVNRAPVLQPIGTQAVAEGQTLTFTIRAVDLDGNALTYSATGLPEGTPGGPGIPVTGMATFDPATRTFSWTPDYWQAGDHTVTFQVSDGQAVDQEAVLIRVGDTNRAPVLDPIGSRAVAEGSSLTVTVSASDPDGDALTYSATGLPAGAAFSPATRTFQWTPGFSQAGEYAVTFSVSDGQLVRSELVVVTVSDTNRPPVLDPIGPRSGTETVPLAFTVTASDPDGDPVTLAATGLPQGASFDTASGAFNWTPDLTQEGQHTVTFAVRDGVLEDTETVAITIAHTNAPPVLDPVGAQQTAEGSPLILSLNATDADGEPLTFSATGVPATAAFDPATAVFSWTPGYKEAGVYTITFSVTDGAATDSEAVTITVNDTNLAPVLGPIGPQTVNEGSALVIQVDSFASDPDGDPLTLGASGLPPGSVYNPTTYAFSWVPDYTQAGAYSVTFSASDGQFTTTYTVPITVADVNRPPALDPVPPQTVDEGQPLAFAVTGSDPEGLPVTFSAAGLPAGAAFDGATRTFTWTPDFTQGGVHTVTISVSDGVSTVSRDVQITVNEVLVASFGPDLSPLPADAVGLVTAQVQVNHIDLDVVASGLSGPAAAAAFDLVFDPAVARFDGFTPGTLLGPPGAQPPQVTAAVTPQSGDPGRLVVGITQHAGAGSSGSGVLLTLHFTVVGTAPTRLDFENAALPGPDGTPLPAIAWSGGILSGL